MPAYYSASCNEFSQTTADSVFNSLARGYEQDKFQSMFVSNLAAWRDSIGQLQEAMTELERCVPLLDLRKSSILLEFWIPRRMRRIDALLLFPGTVAVLEFKANSEDPGDIAQVEDYALDLALFHQPSHHLLLQPLLI